MRPGICRDEHLEAEDLYHQTQASMIPEDQRGNQRWVWGRRAVVEKMQMDCRSDRRSADDEPAKSRAVVQQLAGLAFPNRLALGFPCATKPSRI